MNLDSYILFHVESFSHKLQKLVGIDCFFLAKATLLTGYFCGVIIGNDLQQKFVFLLICPIVMKINWLLWMITASISLIFFPERSKYPFHISLGKIMKIEHQTYKSLPLKNELGETHISRIFFVFLIPCHAIYEVCHNKLNVSVASATVLLQNFLILAILYLLAVTPLPKSKSRIGEIWSGLKKWWEAGKLVLVPTST